MDREKKLKLIDKKERELSKLCMDIAELGLGGRRFIPKHPYILVRVLPKDHVTLGGIYLPDKLQNKPVYEGIVITTWRPYTEKRYKTLPSGQEETITIDHESHVSSGQRIAFAHIEGLPVGDWLDDRYYRLVREGTDQNNWPYMGVFGILDYEGDAETAAEIRRLSAKFNSVTTSGLPVARGANP